MIAIYFYEIPSLTLKSNLGNHDKSAFDDSLGFTPRGPDGRPDVVYLARQRIRKMDREIYETRRDWGLPPVHSHTPSPCPSTSPSPSPPPLRRNGNNKANFLDSH